MLLGAAENELVVAAFVQSTANKQGEHLDETGEPHAKRGHQDTHPTPMNTEQLVVLIRQHLTRRLLAESQGRVLSS